MSCYLCGSTEKLTLRHVEILEDSEGIRCLRFLWCKKCREPILEQESKNRQLLRHRKSIKDPSYDKRMGQYTKTCLSCEIEFKTRRSNKKFCSKQCQQKESRRRNKKYIREYHKQRAGKYKSKKVSVLREHIREQKKKCECTDCGRKNWVIMEFDHLRDKLYNISDMARAGFTIEEIDAEIAKCEPVCCNCHRIRTAKRNGWYDL
jgi:hypothetical protein